MTFVAQFLQKIVSLFINSRLMYWTVAYALICCMPLCAVLFILNTVSFTSFLLSAILISLVCMGSWRPPHEALLYLLLCFLSVALLLLGSELPYLFSVYAIVYVGAVSTLFLFVVMLLGVQLVNILPTAAASNARIFFTGGALLLYFHFCSTVLTQASTFLLNDAWTLSAFEISSAYDLAVCIRSFYSDISALAPLYSTHGALFIIFTWVILTAFFGAVILALAVFEKPAKK